MQGANTIPPRSRLNVPLAVVAVLAIAAFMALVVWAGPIGFGGVETKDAGPAVGAGTAIVHDDAGSMHGGLTPGYAAVHDDAGNMGAGLVPGYAQVHDDAGNVHPVTGKTIVHDDAGKVKR